MSTASTIPDLDGLLRQLAGKYAVDIPGAWRLAADSGATPSDRMTLVPGWAALDREPTPAIVPLLPWRHERRFVELKRTVDERTIENLSTCRFSCMTDGRSMGLAAVLYREFDLTEWIAGSTIVSVMASMAAGRWANVILRMADGVSCGVEASTTLPAGTATLDRHELIARRGVACDRVVDSQVPQNSIYTFTESGVGQYTDVDAELFGLTVDEVSLVRAAYELALHPDRADGLRRQHERISRLVRLAFESDQSARRFDVEGDR